MKKLIVFLIAMLALAGCVKVCRAQQPGPTVEKAKEAIPTCPDRWEPVSGGCYTIASNADVVLIIQLWDQITADKTQTLNWKQGGFKKGQRPEVEKLATKLTDIPGVINVIANAYTLQIVRLNLFSWDVILPKVKKVLEDSELKKTP